MLFSQSVSSASMIRCCRSPSRPALIRLAGLHLPAAMAVSLRELLHLLGVSLELHVLGKEIRPLTDAFGFRSSREQHLTEVQIGHKLRELKAELRVARLWGADHLNSLDFAQLEK